MSDVKRYDLSDGDIPDDYTDAYGGSMYECDDGEYVKFEDYQALQSRLDTIRKLAEPDTASS